MKTNTAETDAQLTAHARQAVLRGQLSDTRAELHALAADPLRFAHEIRLSRENVVSYIETMLAQERRILRELQIPMTHASETDLRASVAGAAAMLRAVACQPADTLGAELRQSLRIWAKAAEIALR